MNLFLSAYTKLVRLRKQYREGSWWRVSYSQADHRSKMRHAQIDLGAAVRAIR
jgi:hypothetical protein